MNKKKENNPFRRFAVILTPWDDFIIDDVGPIEEPSLDYLQTIVAGWIESVNIYAKPAATTPENNGFYAWVNEEGKNQLHPLNPNVALCIGSFVGYIGTEQIKEMILKFWAAKTGESHDRSSE